MDPARTAMANDDSKLARTTRSGAKRMQGDDARRPAAQPPEGAVEVELALEDLVSDAKGEIVFFNDSGYRSLAIRTDRAVVADGKAGAHVTAAGADVSGFKFVTFDNGLTLYFEPGLDLILPNARS